MFMGGVMCESGWSGQSKGTNHAHVTDKFHKVVPGRCDGCSWLYFSLMRPVRENSDNYDTIATSLNTMVKY